MISGFERDADDTLNNGVEHSSRTRFTAALGRPGFFGSSAIPKTRQQVLDLQTQAPSGRPYWARLSSGMNLYCDARDGSIAQASAFLAKHGGPALMLATILATVVPLAGAETGALWAVCILFV